MYDYERITFVAFKDRRLTKNGHESILTKKEHMSRYSKLETVYFLLPLSIFAFLEAFSPNASRISLKIPEIVFLVMLT